MGAPYQVSRSAHGLDISFMQHGLCATEGHRRELFFSELGRSANERVMTMEAKAVCARCPVQGDCFQYALDAEEHGVWGGTTREERQHYVRFGYLPSAKPLRRKRK